MFLSSKNVVVLLQLPRSANCVSDHKNRCVDRQEQVLASRTGTLNMDGLIRTLRTHTYMHVRKHACLLEHTHPDARTHIICMHARTHARTNTHNYEYWTKNVVCSLHKMCYARILRITGLVVLTDIVYGYPGCGDGK